MLRFAWVMLVLAACTEMSVPEYRIPTDTEARDFLAKAVSEVQVGDFAGLCDLTGGSEGNCPVLLQNGVQEAAPIDDPVIVDTYVIPTTEERDGNQRIGGRVVVACGVDASGEPYRTELLTFWYGDELTALHPVYWSGVDVSTGNSTIDPGKDPCP